jgi:hypothetical protein
MLIGESSPVEKGEGQEAVGGAVNGEGAVTLKVHKTNDKTYLSQVVALVRQAQETRSRTQDLANRAALSLTCIGRALAESDLGIAPARAWRSNRRMWCSCAAIRGMSSPFERQVEADRWTQATNRVSSICGPSNRSNHNHVPPIRKSAAL